MVTPIVFQKNAIAAEGAAEKLRYGKVLFMSDCHGAPQDRMMSTAKQIVWQLYTLNI